MQNTICHCHTCHRCIVQQQQLPCSKRLGVGCSHNQESKDRNTLLQSNSHLSKGPILSLGSCNSIPISSSKEVTAQTSSSSLAVKQTIRLACSPRAPSFQAEPPMCRVAEAHCVWIQSRQIVGEGLKRTALRLSTRSPSPFCSALLRMVINGGCEAHAG